MNYTPGPWKLEEDDHKCVAVASSADSRFPHFRICRVWRTRKGSHLQDIGEANARLIAAAPDLLAELERLVRALEPKEETGLDLPGIATLNAARAAIKKATTAHE